MLALVLVFALVDTDPKTIITVKSSAVCTALRQNIAQSVQGLIANDTLGDQGQALLVQSQKVSQAVPLAAGATGGHAPGAQLDTMRMLQLVDVLVKNLDRLDALLGDSHAFPAVARNDAEEALLRERDALRVVEAQQRNELNILSMTANTNSATDLNSRTGLIGVGGAFIPPTAAPYVSFPDLFAAQQAETKKAEAVVAAGIEPLVDRCRR